MSKFWFEFTKDVVPNHMISVDAKDMPEFFGQDRFNGNSMLCKKLEMLPIECIVRGYITGSGWASYQENGTVCGIRLPEGLVESDKLPEPIYTPSTKADLGDHDENISFEKSVEVLEKIYPEKGREYAEKIRDYTIALYKKCAEYALTKGIIIADTKFEFGLNEQGEVVLADEMLTPDSSRFWPLDGYKPGQGQPSFDKQYVRDWLKANPDNDLLLPDEVVVKTVENIKRHLSFLQEANSAANILFIPRYYFAIINGDIMNQDNNINQYINTSIDTKSHTGTKLERCSDIDEHNHVFDELHEECGVFGMYDFDGGNVASTIYYGLFALQLEDRKAVVLQ